MLDLVAQAQERRHRQTLLSTLRHLGAAGLFALAVIDSSPIPTFAGPDILTAILAASHKPLWYEYAASATAGSVLGAYITFRIARRAGSAYLDRTFKKSKLSKFLKLFRKWGTGTLAASTAIPLPTPTSMFFAAAGVSDYPRRKISYDRYSVAGSPLLRDCLRRSVLWTTFPERSAASPGTLGLVAALPGDHRSADCGRNYRQ